MKLFLLACVFTSIYGYSPRVRIEEGELEGTIYTLSNNETVYVFRGIPYAAPPIGENRFEEPQPPRPWNGIRSAKSNGNVCIQIPYIPGGNSSEPIGDEDCLYLNVFTPKLPKKKNFSDDELMMVLFFFPGGGFYVGSSGEADPDYILQQQQQQQQQKDGIVFVSCNYRVGPLGFFGTDDPSAPGNYGLKDQVKALKWVHRNIRFFGGDPNKVTIFGDSAGGASVYYHMVSPLNMGLFRSAIASSGSVSLPWSLPRQVVKTSYKLASKFNCTNKNVKLMKKCLKRVPATDIIVEESPFKRVPTFEIVYGPQVEPLGTNRPFLPQDPYKLIKEGKVKHTPFMVTVVQTEGSVGGLGIVPNNEILEQTNENWNSIAPILFYYNYIEPQAKKDNISSSIQKRYFGNVGLTNQTSSEFLDALTYGDFYDRLFNVTKTHSSVVPVNLYCYKFYYRGTESTSDFFPNTNGKNYGACHGDDMLYILKSGNKKNKNDLEMAKQLCSKIVAFMKKGNPSTKDVPWHPISKNGVMNCLAIYSPEYQRMKDIENQKATRFWNDLLPYEYENNN